MASLNKVMLIGNLGRDPEPRTFPDGGMVTNASIATTEKWTDKQTGQTVEHTEWHNLVFNGRLAEIAAQYLRKGSPVYVEGSIRTRKWQDKNGQDRYTTEIRVMQLQMLGSRADGARAQGAQYDNSAPYSSPAPVTGVSRPAQNLRVVQPPAGVSQPGMIEMSRQALAREGVHVPPYKPPAESSNGFDDFEDDVPF